MTGTGGAGWTDADSLRVVSASRDRDRDVIHAMQQRIARNPIRDLFWRRPWRSRTSFGSGIWGWPPRIAIGNAWNWIANAHDCKDPSVGCSCSGGFRFPSS